MRTREPSSEDVRWAKRAEQVHYHAEVYTREYAYARMRRDDDKKMTNRRMAFDLVRCACYRANAVWHLGLPWTIAGSETRKFLSMVAAFSHCIVAGSVTKRIRFVKSGTADIQYDRVHLYTYGY